MSARLLEFTWRSYHSSQIGFVVAAAAAAGGQSTAVRGADPVGHKSMGQKVKELIPGNAKLEYI